LIFKGLRVVEQAIYQRGVKMEEKKTEAINESDELSRGDFLKIAGAAGLGLAGLGAFMSSPASAQDSKKGKYLFVVTAGADYPDKAILPLLLADIVQKRELGEVHIWMVLYGAELCKKGRPEKIVGPAYQKFGNALHIMERIHRNGGGFGVCPPCAEWVGAVGNDRIEYVKNQGGDWLMENIRDSWVSWL
jgi:predicted peroxiredoxin